METYRASTVLMSTGGSIKDQKVSGCSSFELLTLNGSLWVEKEVFFISLVINGPVDFIHPLWPYLLIKGASFFVKNHQQIVTNDSMIHMKIVPIILVQNTLC